MQSEGFSHFFAFLGFFEFFFVFLHFSSLFSASLHFFPYYPKTRANDVNLLGKWDFHSDPVCTDPVQKFPTLRCPPLGPPDFSAATAPTKSFWGLSLSDMRLY